MTAGNKDFRGKDLRGQSFKRQNLAGADFSAAQLGGVDFSGADLIGAKFCRAVMGHAWKGRVGLWIGQMLLGLLAGFLLAVGSALGVFTIQAFLKEVGLPGVWHNAEIMIGLAIVSTIVVWLAIQRKRLDYIWWYCLELLLILTAAGAGARAIVGMVVGTSSVVVTGAGVILVVAAVAVAGTVVGAVGGARVVAGAVVAAVAVTIAVAVVQADADARAAAVAEAEAEAGDNAGGVARDSAVEVVVAVAATSIIFLLLAIYLNRRALSREEPQLALLRRWHLFFNSLGATQFPTQICDADFTGANLRYARFAKTTLQNCIWRDASNLQLALTRGSLLETPQVRQLVTGSQSAGTPNHTDFSGLNLTGIHLAGMALSGYHFSHANLANANFSGCDLTNADFTGANVTGANFCGATLTGAIIDNWNIDPHTHFGQHTACDFVWLAPKKDSKDKQQRERNPPSGNFKPGEFAKLYQQVTDTIDFILHSRDELDAIMRSVAYLKAHGAEIEVESVERKNESVILRLKAAPEISREQIYAEVKQQFTLELTVEKTKVHMLEQQRDNLSTLLIGIANRPVNQFYQQGNHNQQGADMPQNIVTQSGNTFNQSPVGIGQTVTITQSIAALPDSQTELKTLLTRLATLIEHSPLPDNDKKDAMQQTGIIVEAAQQADAPHPGGPHPGGLQQVAPQASRVQRALSYIQTIFSALPEAGAIIEQLQDLASQIGSWFGK